MTLPIWPVLYSGCFPRGIFDTCSLNHSYSVDFLVVLARILTLNLMACDFAKLFGLGNNKHNIIFFQVESGRLHVGQIQDPSFPASALPAAFLSRRFNDMKLG